MTEKPKTEPTPQPEPNDADRERAEKKYLYLDCDAPNCVHIKPEDGAGNCPQCDISEWAAELAAVRVETYRKRDSEWSKALGTEHFSFGSPEEHVANRNLLSPGPCGNHPKAFWRATHPDNVRTFMGDGTETFMGTCTACESEKERMKPLVEALNAAYLVLLKRDEMNAAVHCQELRLSPVTDKARAALKAAEGK